MQAPFRPCLETHICAFGGQQAQHAVWVPNKPEHVLRHHTTYKIMHALQISEAKLIMSSVFTTSILTPYQCSYTICRRLMCYQPTSSSCVLHGVVPELLHYT